MEFSAVRSIPAKECGNRGFFPSKKVKKGIMEYELFNQIFSTFDSDVITVVNHCCQYYEYEFLSF